MTDSKGWIKAAKPEGACPAADELWRFGQGELAIERRDAVRGHLTECVWCRETAARISELDAAGAATPLSGKTSASPVQPPFDAPVPPSLDRKTRRIWSADPWRRLWRSQALWMALFALSIGVSFFQPRYYKQFLVIALVAGIRWALSERAAHRVAVWGAIAEDSGSGSSRRDAGGRAREESSRSRGGPFDRK